MSDQRFGLKESTIEKINGVFTSCPQIEKVILYGSRAKGNYRHGSDIDLTIIGNELTHPQMLRLANELDDLLLPYKIDLSLFHKITNPNLVEHIRRVGKVFYERTDS
ncbi:nucleotidyltransferase [Geotalea daltonii FRC-32]|uniref:Nucleotidyltransferase n=1 Tax=Geotalea daltonii (strain DSM 22248 / JCM 15807 / FRC-32) TaxID=316067 RepID=B9M4U9_GEODF|nr:nucleotidyltransferase domain-containing protein [Geotalea daltonii]ACM21633.1 nucleotidyltransferase [Geotalea daltonii FRC-32]